MKTTIAILIILLLAFLAYSMWRYMLARAIRIVVEAFRKQKALDAKRAASIEALGLKERKGLVGNAFKPRDYRQTAIRIMGQEGIIRMVEGPKFYLSEDKLDGSRVKRFANIK